MQFNENSVNFSNNQAFLLSMQAQWVTDFCLKCGGSSKRMRAVGTLPPRNCSKCDAKFASCENAAEGSVSVLLPPLLDRSEVWDFNPLKTHWDDAPWWDWVFYSAAIPILDLGMKKPLTVDDVPDIFTSYKTKVLGQKLRDSWEQEQQKPKPYFAYALFRAFYIQFYSQAFWSLFKVIFFIIQPIFIMLLLREVRKDDGGNRAYIWASCLNVGGLITTMIHHQYFYVGWAQGVVWRSSILFLLHEKLLKVNMKAVGTVSTGYLLNVATTDLDRTNLVDKFLHFMWAGPLAGVAVTIIIGLLIGWPAALSGMSVFVVLVIPFQIWSLKKLVAVRKITSARTTERINLISQILKGITTVKSYVWEDSFLRRVEEIRNKETDSLFWNVFLRGLSSVGREIIGMFSIFVMISIEWYEKREIDLTTIFTIIALMEAVSQAIGIYFTRVMLAGGEFLVAIDHIQEFLQLEEYSADHIYPSEDSQNSIEFDKASFYWDESFNVSDISLQIEKGELIIISGVTGCGKSTFLYGILGETQRTGVLKVMGDCSFCSQEYFILSATLRENILFGTEFEIERYNEVLSMCALREDLESLQNGDKTQLGENGVNLSGGQKARLCLARALYSKSEIILLDDPLSAVDSHVAAHIFNSLYEMKKKATKTIILVTHHDEFFQYADRVFVIEEGKLKLLSEEAFKRQESLENEEHKVYVSEKKQEFADLIQEESKEIGSISMETWKTFFSSGGYNLFFLSFLLMIVARVFVVGSDLWIQEWASQDFEEQQKKQYWNIFAVFVFGSAVLYLIKTISFVNVSLKASSGLHNEASLAVVNSPLHFFSSNPHGRIVNRFSSDQNAVDEILTWSFFESSVGNFKVISALIVCCVIVPWILILVPFLLYTFYWYQNYFLTSSRELKRCIAVTKSPIMSLYSQCLFGLTSIRAFKAEKYLLDQMEHHIDTNGKVFVTWMICGRCFGARLDLIGVIIMIFISFIGILANIQPGLFAVALVYSMSLSGLMQYIVRLSAEVQDCMTSVERINQYANLPSEGLLKAPMKHNFSKYDIEYRNVGIRYREDLPTIVKGVNFKLPQGTRVGVCGRTGSGKSTTVMGVTRLNEICEGAIYIDGKDISMDLGLHDLRHLISYVPQKAHFFSGSLRFNLDPNFKYTHEELNQALNIVELKQTGGRDITLDMDVGEEGNTFSAGEKQLISLARAILHDRPIVIMDEATANVDYATDELLQKTIREADVFQSKTIFIIAHRINTILDCDQIAVFDQGELVEFEPPLQLLSRDSIFRSLAEKNGLQEEDWTFLKSKGSSTTAV